MIYPLDVHKRSSEVGKLIGREKNKFIIMIAIIGNIICFFFISTIFKKFLNLGLIWAVLTQLVLFSFLGWFIFRHFIFKESEKIREYKTYATDSFAKFYNMRKEVQECLEVEEHKVNIFEYTNGASTFCLCLRYGSNDTRKANNTKIMFAKIFRSLASKNLEFRTTVMPEDFETSPEYLRYVRKISKIEDRKLSNTVLSEVDNILSNNTIKSNVDILYIFVKTKSNYQKFELDVAIRDVLKIMRETTSCIRSVTFLDKSSLNEFVTSFYGMEAIDLSMIKALTPDEDLMNEYMELVKLYQIKSIEGKVFTDKKVLNNHLNTKAKEVVLND